MVSWSKGGSYVASLSASIPNSVWIWSITGGSDEESGSAGGGLANLITFRQPVRSFRFSPVDDLLCIATSTSRVYMFSFKDGVTYIDLPPVYKGMEVVSVRWGGGNEIVAVGRKGVVFVRLSQKEGWQEQEEEEVIEENFS